MSVYYLKLDIRPFSSPIKSFIKKLEKKLFVTVDNAFDGGLSHLFLLSNT